MNPGHRLRSLHIFLLLVALLVVGGAAAMVGGAELPSASAATAKPKLVRIVHSPRARTSNRNPVFHIKRASKAKARCKIDKRRYRSCRTRVKYKGVTAGVHVFRVRAHRNGRTTVQRRTWTIVKRGAPLPPPSTKLRFDDEFNGTKLNTAQWSAWNAPGYVGNGLRRASAFSVSGGNLIVTAKMVNGTLVTGGMSHRQDYKYGRYEFRVRTEKDPTATTSGVVMTWPLHQRSPEFTENDMYETGPVANRSTLDTYIHYGPGVTTQKIYRHKVNASNWHTIVMDWRKDEMQIYRDGRLVFAVNERYAIPDVLHHMCIQLDARHKRKLKQPVRMFVDYVRIYE